MSKFVTGLSVSASTTMVKIIILVGILVVFASSSNGSIPCNKQSFNKSSFVCVCSESSCDTIDSVQAEEKGTYLAYTSNRDKDRFAIEKGIMLAGVENLCYNRNTTTTITVKRSEKQQEILGFGGAFSDATGINVNKLTDDMKAKFMQSYFSKDGLEYNFGRVPMAATDFSLHSYSYDDLQNDNATDPNLEAFSLQKEDVEYKIPLIKQAIEINPDLYLFASTWTAPKWMKTNRQYTGGEIKKEFYQAWADYFVKFFESYDREGISFWGVTTGNEPSLALVNGTINSVRWLPAAMKKWIGENLGPAIRNSKFNHLKLLMLDDQRFFLPGYPDKVLQNGTEIYVDGIAVHWYWDAVVSPYALVLTHQHFPDKILLNTESCRGDKPWEEAVLLGDWSRAEDYAHGIIEDLNNCVQGWVDWNLALDLTGGPTYIDNQVDSAIIVDAGSNSFYKQPIYYAMGHFSKFIPRGSYKIDQSVSTRNIEAAAFERRDGGVVVVVLNRMDRAQDILINDAQSGHIKWNVTPKSITTILYW